MSPLGFREIIAENIVQFRQEANDLRRRFFEWYDADSNEYDEEDVKELRENDYYCQRFVAHCMGLHDNADRTLEMVKSVFKWRKESGVNHTKDSDFPEEFYTSEEIFPYRKDKEGNVTIMLKVCKHVNDSKKKEMFHKFVIHNIEKVEKMYRRRMHVTLIVDCKDAGIRNIDLDAAMLIRTMSMKRYPLLLSYVIVINMPWIFTAAWKIVKSWLPQRAVERVFFVTEKTITDHIDREDVPEGMGGLDKTVYPLEDPYSSLPEPESLLTDFQTMTIATP